MQLRSIPDLLPEPQLFITLDAYQCTLVPCALDDPAGRNPAGAPPGRLARWLA